MQYQIDQFKVRVDQKEDLQETLKRVFKLKEFQYKILSRSIDARNKKEIYFVYKLWVQTEEKLKGKGISIYVNQQPQIAYPQWTEPLSPVVVGFGPAGIFASLYLARCGAKPIIIERGGRIEERVEAVNHFMKTRQLNPNNNVQFGEGGAGAFSDGKLNTNVKSPWIHFILEEFVQHGAKEDILYDSMPHIGTDFLREVVKNMRKEIEALGGRFYFHTLFKEFKIHKDRVFVYTQKETFETKHILLGIGHSAKDTIRYLYGQQKLVMEPKAFSMGVRVEHRAETINRAQYGAFSKDLPKAYYKLAHHSNQRGIYTFCMCPGGYVLASASEENTIVTNGMSNQEREGKNSNSAILVDVRPEDFHKDVEAGLQYQETYERLAFRIGNDYRAPANLMKEFMEDTIATQVRGVETTYPHGLIFCDLRKCLPDFVVEGIKEGIEQFNHKLKGFYDPDAILIGIETRSSSPVRILRDANKKSSIPYLYPIGEGAGYAGGITSAALDGLRTAMQIVEDLDK